jgi:hypothetical protein
MLLTTMAFGTIFIPETSKSKFNFKPKHENFVPFAHFGQDLMTGWGGPDPSKR